MAKNGVANNYYSVVQYVPDPTRDERINVGIVVASEDGTIGRAKFPKDWSRVRQFGREDVTFLRDFANSLERDLRAQLQLMPNGERWHLDSLQRFSAEWQNSIQISEPRVSSLSPEQLVDEMYERLVKEPPPRQHAFKDKRTAVSLARTAMRRAALERYGKRDLVKGHVWIKGSLDEHEFDVAIENHRPVLAVKGLSFEVPPSPELERDVDAVAWAIDDISRGPEHPSLGVVALPPKGTNREYARARKIYEALNATFVTPDQVDDWAKTAVAQLPARL